MEGFDGMKKQLEKIPDSGKPRLAEAAARLADLYAVTNRPGEEKIWRAERLNYPPEVAPPPRLVK